MPAYRCPNDPSHDTFRVRTRLVVESVHFTHRSGTARENETELLREQEVVEAICAECGAVAEALDS